MNIREYHRKAMDIADQAFIARREGAHEQAEQLFRDAYELEFEAAQRTTKEPGRSILHRSAATLALHGKLPRESEKVVALGLAGDPPPEIANELREVFEKINFHRHLSLQGIELNPNEIQMSIIGNAISDGMALVDDVVVRVQNLEKLFIRTGQRINNRPFGRIPKDSKTYSLFISPPRAGSFAVTLRVGQPQQGMLPGMDNRQQIIDEVIFNLDLLNEQRIDDLRKAIPEKEYLESFLGVAKNIAPDGDSVRMVGVTALREGIEVSVGFSVVRKNIKPVIDDMTEANTSEEGSRERIQIIGNLLIGDAITNKIKIVDDNNKRHSIEVSEAIAEDVVRPYFGTRVVVDVTRVGKKRLIFKDINPSET